MRTALHRSVMIVALLAGAVGCTEDDPEAAAGDAGQEGGSTGAPRTCSDGVMNEGEADVDCGGPCPTACAEEATCDRDADCESAFCHPESGLCATPYCGDGFRNQGETGVDCGGTCDEACPDAEGCEQDADCASGFCDAEGACVEPACDDGARNQDETDVDCGGGCDARCDEGQGCAADADCDGGFCDPDAGACAEPSCNDGFRNQDETDVDCGGGCGDGCDDGQDCEEDGDCTSDFCHPDTSRCAPMACDNGDLDEDETDVDCGGTCGDSCDEGDDCEGDGDCMSGFCDPDADTCATAGCSDGVQNQDETDEDCGGECGATCEVDEGCAGDDDCVSGFCDPDADTCQEPSCGDGFQNQDETDEDCGGECGATCEEGEGCGDSGDCEGDLECMGDVCSGECAAALDPADDGSSAARQALVISEIDPGSGGYVELYNATGSAIALGTSDYQLCSPFAYSALSTLGSGITIPAGSYARLDWPASFTDTDAGGEVILYLDGSFSTGTSIMDFVCWGTNPHSSRKALAESASKWSGECASALSNGAIHREPETAGTAAADYDTSAAKQPQTCTP